MRKRNIIYILWLLGTIGVIYAIVQAGNRLEAPAALPIVTPPDPAAPSALAKAIPEWFHNPLALLLVQAMVIVPLARILGNLFIKIHQPMVIGEIIAGLLLGPSFLGWAFPQAYAILFPPHSLQGLQLLSQVGLIFFMFLVGLEFNPKFLKGHGEAAVAVSNSSILTPFLLGSLLALYLYPKLSDASVHFGPFALFMGAAMSVTAFPVLARILAERKLTQTKMGALVLTCAAVDDVSAWFLLAFVISVVKATGPGQLFKIMALTFVYIAIMIWVLRPMLQRFEKRYSTREGLSQNAVGVIFLLLLASSLASEQIGIHALFGAFFLGAVMPNETGFVRHLSEKIEDIAVLFLLPLFFAYTGLRTQVGLLQTPELWGVAGLILATACLGKFGGSFVAAKLMGIGLRESAAIGILMNTRGLMELVIISIGLDLGVISPALFTMLVLMALITTFITSPLLHWVYPTERFHDVVEVPVEKEKPFTVLVSIALLRAGGGLLKIAQALAGTASPSRIYVLHLVRSSDRPSYYVKGSDAMEEYSQLQPLLEPFMGGRLDLRPLSFPTVDPAEDIVEVARVKAADLILLGWHKPVLGQTVLGGTVHEVMKNSRSTVAVFIERGLQQIRRILVPYISSTHDRAALGMAQRMARALHSQVVILHVLQPQHAVEDPHAMRKSFDEDFLDPETESRVKLEVIESLSPIEAVLEESRKGYDLVIIGVSEDFDLEHRLFGLRPERIAAECPVSMLIVRQAPNGDGAKVSS